MKRIVPVLGLLAFLCISQQSTAQITTVFTEDFEVNSSLANTVGTSGNWTVSYFGTRAYYPYNTFQIEHAANCGYGAIGGTQFMQVKGVLDQSTFVCAYQGTNPAQNPGYAAFFYRTVSALNVTNLRISYKWKCKGEANGDYGNLIYTTDMTGSTGWTVVGSNLQRADGTTDSVVRLALPSVLNNRQFLLGWKFTSNGSTENTPGLIVDDILIEAAEPVSMAGVGTIVGTSLSGPVSRNSTNNILRIKIPVTGNTGTLTLNSLKVKSCNNNDACVSAVKVWSGTQAAPSTQQMGTGAAFTNKFVTFNGLSQNLAYGDNYIWITYDINNTANMGDTLRAMIDTASIMITGSGGASDPGNLPVNAIDSPQYRMIDYCNFAITGEVEPITRVTFLNIDQTSSDIRDGSPAQENFTSQVAVVTRGNTYPITVKGNTVGSYIDSVRVFIDWNQDGIFAGQEEQYDIGALFNSTGVDNVSVSANITVPSSAVVGNTRMRVTKKYQVYATACNEDGYGQAEDYTLSVQSTLPVTFASFRGERAGKVNRLTWTTANEINNAGFTVQRSANATDFVSIGSVASKAVNGNSSAPLQYTMDDIAPLRGTGYYRLQQTDKDGKIMYSSIVSIKGDKVTAVQVNMVYPNPAISVLNASIESPADKKVTILVTDMTGRVVMAEVRQLTEGTNNLQLGVNRLTSGMYLLKILSDDNTTSAATRFVKQ